jgi:hypothetical protein
VRSRSPQRRSQHDGPLLQIREGRRRSSRQTSRETALRQRRLGALQRAGQEGALFAGDDLLDPLSLQVGQDTAQSGTRGWQVPDLARIDVERKVRQVGGQQGAIAVD